MSDIFPEAIEAAAERYEASLKRFFSEEMEMSALVQHYNDQQKLARAYLARLAADRSEQEQRSRLINAESSTSRGFGPETMNGRSLLLDGPGEVCELWLDASGEVSVAQGDDLVSFPGMPDVTAEGQLDDLLRVLKGGVK